MLAQAPSTLSAAISISCLKRWRARMKTLPKTYSQLRQASSAAPLRLFPLVHVTRLICLTTRKSSSAQLYLSVLRQIHPIGACFFTSHSNTHSFEPESLQKNNKRCHTHRSGVDAAVKSLGA